MYGNPFLLFLWLINFCAAYSFPVYSSGWCVWSLSLADDDLLTMWLLKFLSSCGTSDIQLMDTMFSTPSCQILTYSGPTPLIRHGTSCFVKSSVYISAAKSSAGVVDSKAGLKNA